MVKQRGHGVYIGGGARAGTPRGFVQEGRSVGIVDEDTLRSELFNGSRHFESIRSDLRQIRFRADRNSRGGCLQLHGLERTISSRRSSDIWVGVGSEGRTIILRFHRIDRQLDGESGATGARMTFEIRGVGEFRVLEG